MNKNSVSKGNVVALWQRRDAMINPAVTSLIRYWEGLRLGDEIPHRTDVDPRAFQDILPYSFILERTKPGSVRFRLAGHHLTRLMGMDVRGMQLRSLFELSDRKDMLTKVEGVFEGPASYDADLLSAAEGTMSLRGRMTLMPLRGYDGSIDKALGIIVTDGLIGIAPRRFRVHKQILHPVTAETQQAMRNRFHVNGLAEAARRFDHEPAGQSLSDGPALRVVDGGKP